MKSKRCHRGGLFKRRVITILKYFFCGIYIFITSLLPMYIFLFTFLMEKHLLYAATLSFASLIGMDIICSLLEDGTTKIYHLVVRIREKRQKEKKELENQKAEKIKELEKLLLEQQDDREKIEQVKNQVKQFKKEIKSTEKIFPKDMLQKLLEVCTKMKELLEAIENDTAEYHPIRHTFQVYFPEFQKMTYLYMDIAKGDSLDVESLEEYQEMITEFDQYLDYIKAGINTSDKLNLKIGIKSLIKIMEAERKKGEE